MCIYFYILYIVKMVGILVCVYIFFELKYVYFFWIMFELFVIGLIMKRIKIFMNVCVNIIECL